MNPRVNRLVGGLAVVLAGFYFYMTLQIPTRLATASLGPRVFPYVLAGLLAVCGLWAIAASYRAGTAEAEDRGHVEWTGWPLVVATIVVMAAYALLFERLGFILDTALLLLIILSYSNRGAWRANVLIAVCFALATGYGFNVLLGIPLPAGILPLWGVR